MKVLVYVEGPSDVGALEKILRDVISQGREAEVGISFHHLGGKAKILRDCPRKAASHLQSNPEDWVFSLPDLYPMSTFEGKYQHGSFDEMKALLEKAFLESSTELGLPPTAASHFRVHCLKHDLEALLLGAPDQLKKRLNTKDSLHKQWRLPVEDQNDDKPPKRVVEDLFKRYRKRRKYRDTIDAPWILERASLSEVEKACSQCFHPFVEDLRRVISEASKN